MRLISLISVLVAGSVPFSLRFACAAGRPTFRAGSELAVMHVSVRDRGGRYVTGLTRDAFTVIDDGKPQTLEMFSADEVPASVGFLIDNSNSMRPSRDRVIASSLAFAANSHPQDEIFVLTFNETVRQAWGPAIVSEMVTGAFPLAMSDADHRARHDGDLRRHRGGLVAARAGQAHAPGAGRRQRRRRQREQDHSGGRR